MGAEEGKTLLRHRTPQLCDRVSTGGILDGPIGWPDIREQVSHRSAKKRAFSI